MKGWVYLDYPFISNEAITDSQKRIADIIDTWWNSASFDPTNVSFGAHVILYHHIATKDWYLDPRTINPYEDRLILCYKIHKARHKIELLGTLQARQHMLSDGYFGEANLTRTRRANIPEENSSLPSTETTEPLFYFPVCNVHRIRELVPNKNDLKLALQNRVNWLLECLEKNTHTLELQNTTPEEDVVSLIMMSLIHQGMEFVSTTHQYAAVCVPKMRSTFYKISIKAEKYRFMSKFSRFRTESAVIDLIDHNQLLKGINFVRAEQLDPIDYQCFFNRFGNDPSIQPPTLFFKVPLEEVPHALAKDLPLHTGMQLHLSYLDVALWVWNVYEISFQRYGTRMQRDAPLEQWVVDLSKRILLFKPKNTIPKQINIIRTVDPKAGFSVDIQKLIDCMPPCMKAVVNNHFPRNPERMTIIPSLREAGINLETAENLFENLNNRYPAAGGGAVELRVRFNVKALWNRPQGTTYCKRIIERTTANAQDQMHCPFVAKTGEKTSVPNCRACKSAAGMLEIEDMYAPHLFLQNKLMAKSEAIKEPSLKKTREIADNSSSDSDEVEEEIW